MSEVEWWHGSTAPLERIDAFLHVGTLDQAGMRGGRGCHMTKVQLSRGRTVRRRDKGFWREKDLKAIRSKGAAYVVYLNRYEGIPLEELEAARARNASFDDLADAAFHRLVPSARDSIIVLDEAMARIVPEDVSTESA